MRVTDFSQRMVSTLPNSTAFKLFQSFSILFTLYKLASIRQLLSLFGHAEHKMQNGIHGAVHRPPDHSQQTPTSMCKLSERGLVGNCHLLTLKAVAVVFDQFPTCMHALPGR